jgi:hypothetical protein
MRKADVNGLGLRLDDRDLARLEPGNVPDGYGTSGSARAEPQAHAR